jgi:hypothetical protein
MKSRASIPQKFKNNSSSWLQVHSSDKPELWNMTKDLLIAFGIASVGILGSVLLLYFASLDRVNWWPSSAQLEITGQPGITPGQVRLVTAAYI